MPSGFFHFVKCHICNQKIVWYDTRHIAQHTARDLIACWIVDRVLSDEEVNSPFYLYDLRKIILQKTDIDPDDMLKISVLVDWLVNDGLPRDLIEGWVKSFE